MKNCEVCCFRDNEKKSKEDSAENMDKVDIGEPGTSVLINSLAEVLRFIFILFYFFIAFTFKQWK